MDLDERLDALAAMVGKADMLDGFPEACQKALDALRLDVLVGAEPEVLARQWLRLRTIDHAQVIYLLTLRSAVVGEMAANN